MDHFLNIYESMAGLLEAEAAVPGVENAFEEGSLCASEYERMRSAYERLCLRLGAVNEDPDLEIMVESMEAIQKELCRRMYQRTF